MAINTAYLGKRSEDIITEIKSLKEMRNKYEAYWRAFEKKKAGLIVSSCFDCTLTNWPGPYELQGF